MHQQLLASFEENIETLTSVIHKQKASIHLSLPSLETESRIIYCYYPWNYHKFGMAVRSIIMEHLVLYDKFIDIIPFILLCMINLLARSLVRKISQELLNQRPF